MLTDIGCIEIHFFWHSNNAIKLLQLLGDEQAATEVHRAERFIHCSLLSTTKATAGLLRV